MMVHLQMNANNEEKYTFRNFVVGSCNEDAYNLAKNIAEQNDVSKKILYIYGGEGSGKSHLLSAIKNSIVIDKISIKVVSMTAEQFVNEVVRSLDKKELHEFQNIITAADVFMIDNIEFLENKEIFQEILAETMEILIQNSSRLVITANVPAGELCGIKNEKLKKVLHTAYSVKLNEPDYEIRVALLEQLIDDAGISITNNVHNVIAFVANEITTDTRNMFTVMQKALTLSELMGEELTKEFIEGLL